jgi:hypothetical protein
MSPTEYLYSTFIKLYRIQTEINKFLNKVDFILNVISRGLFTNFLVLKIVNFSPPSSRFMCHLKYMYSSNWKQIRNEYFNINIAVVAFEVFRALKIKSAYLTSINKH